MRRAVLVAALLGALGPGCLYGRETLGSRRFVERWRAPEGARLHAATVMRRLGPPTRIRVVAGQLWAFYRFREVLTTSLALRYYLDVFKRVNTEGLESELTLVFDAHDRLLYATLSAPPRGR